MKNNYRISLTNEEIDQLSLGEAIYIQVQGFTIEINRFEEGNEYDNN